VAECGAEDGSDYMELAINELKKSYGKKEVLKGVNYVFTPGIYGVLGVNVPRYILKA
jgi:hypothetical protein